MLYFEILELQNDIPSVINSILDLRCMCRFEVSHLYWLYEGQNKNIHINISALTKECLPSLSKPQEQYCDISLSTK